tara:strand:+ start:523 stop:1422 length:900 start_codon:yes stop_codon:yes gene_type:complete
MKFNNKLQKTKHSKIKNTSLLFEFLTRQLTVEILNKKSNTALKIIKKRFNENTELGKELQLYSTLLKTNFNSDKKADYLISETLNQRSKLNNQKLRREKYNLIKEIKDTYDLKKFLSSKINNYKIYATVYRLFEYKNITPEEKTEFHFNLIEHLTTDNKPDQKLTTINETISGIKKDSDLRILSYKILLEKFNKKYINLDTNQKNVLRAYINNLSNTNSLKEYIQKNVPKIKSSLKKHVKNVDEKIVKIKLKEAIHSIEKICEVKSDNIKDNVVVTLLRYYELLKELKKNASKNKKVLK